MGTTTDRRAKQLERVRALFAKAEGTPYPEEAETFRAKADELMAAYALEQWQVDEANGAATARPKPEVRQVDFSWWNRSTPQRETLWSLFNSVARHCRCTVALRGWGEGGGSYTTIPCIGLPSDLDYMDMLFTHLMLQMGRQLRPQVDEGQTVGENALRMRQAGMGMRDGREAMAPLLWRHGLLPLTKAQQAKFMGVTPEDSWRSLPSTLQKSLVGRVRRALNDEAEKQGVLVDTTIHPAVYQRSFAMGFTSEVGKRFAAMRAQQAETRGTGMELALVDIAKQAANMYEDLWPEPEDDGKGSKALTREVRYSHRAASAGRDAGAKADIAAAPGKGIGGRKGLPS